MIKLKLCIILLIMALSLTGCNLLPEEEVHEEPELVDAPEPDVNVISAEKDNIRKEKNIKIIFENNYRIDIPKAVLVGYISGELMMLDK